LNIVIRADASIKIGGGHIMRCISLATYLKNYVNNIYFISSNSDNNLKDYVLSCGFEFYEIQHFDVDSTKKYNFQKNDADQSIPILEKIKKIDWVIVDHYQLDVIWETRIRPYTSKIMVIDDLANRFHDCDLLLDQNWFNNMNNRYNNLMGKAVCLFGPKYALLRNEFLKARKLQKTREGSVNRILIFFGSGDPENFTGKLLKLLSISEFKNIYVDVVVGSMNPNIKKIYKQVYSRQNTSLHVQTRNMAQIISKVDLALCAGGSTTWERMCLGLPSMVWTLAENQREFTKDLDSSGFLVWMGDASNFSISKSKLKLRRIVLSSNSNSLMSKKCRKLVDGNGVERVGQKILELST